MNPLLKATIATLILVVGGAAVQRTFEIDFKRDMYLKDQKLNREGLRHKDGKYFQRGTAKIGLLVAAENWTKVTAQP